MIKKNIKKFQKETEKFEESSAFKSAKKQFGVFSTVKVRIDNNYVAIFLLETL